MVGFRGEVGRESILAARVVVREDRVRGPWRRRREGRTGGRSREGGRGREIDEGKRLLSFFTLLQREAEEPCFYRININSIADRCERDWKER